MFGNRPRSIRDGRLRNKCDRESKIWKKRERKEDIRATRNSCYPRKQILICVLAVAHVDFSKLVFDFPTAHNAKVLITVVAFVLLYRNQFFVKICVDNSQIEVITPRSASRSFRNKFKYNLSTLRADITQKNEIAAKYVRSLSA